jgi:hypothetical protein
MIRHIRGWLLPILFCFALSTGVLAQEKQTAQKTEPGQAASGSVITGRAVYDDTGKAAARERVQLIASEALSTPPGRLRIPTTVTNGSGEFSFRSIPAGEFYVFTRPIDEHTSSGQALSFLQTSGDSAADAARIEQFKKDHIRIAVDGVHNLEINLRVHDPHFGTISGRVLDPTGNPAIRASVHLMSRGEKPFGASVLTDEQGQYKFWGLAAGEYIISASPPAKESDAGTSPPRIEGLPGATYFPSTLDSHNSPPVTVVADRDSDNVEVKLIARSLRRLAGTVRMRGDNQPVAASLRLSPKEIAEQSSVPTKPGIEGAMSNYLCLTDKSGHWSFANVPDGAYRLFIEPKLGESTKQRFVQQVQDITVEGADVEDLLIEVSAGTRISGSITIEGNNGSPQSIRVAASHYPGNANSLVRMDEGGTFVLTEVPVGEITLSAFVLPPDKFYVKSIEANGLDLLRTNLTITEGQEIKDVRIVISSDVGVVMGRVLAGDKPLAGVNVMLRRVTNDKMSLPGGKLTGVTDDRGNFMLSAAPGNYVVLAWRASDGPPALRDAMDRAVREQGPGIILAPNDRKQIDIRIP